MTEEGEVLLWCTCTWKLVRTIPQCSTSGSLGLHGDLLMCMKGEKVRVFSVETGQCVYVLERTDGRPVVAMATWQNVVVLAAACDGSARLHEEFELFDAATGKARNTVAAKHMLRVLDHNLCVLKCSEDALLLYDGINFQAINRATGEV